MTPPPHWIKENSASRWPHRWICWDTESRWETVDKVTTHTFRLATACWWDHNLKRHQEPEYGSFDKVSQLWEYIAEHCEREGRTIAYAHNLGFDIQLSNMFGELPRLGFELGWFNLDRDCTMVTWHRGKQTLVLSDTMTFLPASIERIASLVGDTKNELPANDAPDEEWYQRCQSDVRVLATAVMGFNSWARGFDIGNWRSSGSGLAWSLWRHRFLKHKVLASSSPENAAAERAGMVTGRAEVWRIGDTPDRGFYDWDMARCYCTIAAQCEVPIKHMFTVPALTLSQYRQWRTQFAVLSHVTVTQEKPIVGLHDGTGFRWPVGTFETWAWDSEIDLLLESGARVEFGESRRYLKAPALKSWAEWTLAELDEAQATVPAVVGLWVKSQSRSLIGRFGMRYHGWNPHPDGDYLGITGLSIEQHAGQEPRTVMHAAGKAWIESERTDSDDCVPAITGWIMGEARRRLWLAMEAVGAEHLWHVDTDGILTDNDGSARLQAFSEANPDHGWLLKAKWSHGEIRGTRNFSLGDRPHIAGVPWKAKRVSDVEWAGEMWQGVRQGLQTGHVDRVQVRNATWKLTAPDSRRVHLDDGSTRAFEPGEYDRLYPRGLHGLPKVAAHAMAT